jgi:hypothetical protein
VGAKQGGCSAAAATVGPARRGRTTMSGHELERGKSVLQRAVEADHQGKHATAIELYMRGLEHLNRAMKQCDEAHAPNQPPPQQQRRQKELIKAQFVRYLTRAEHLKAAAAAAAVAPASGPAAAAAAAAQPEDGGFFAGMRRLLSSAPAVEPEPELPPRPQPHQPPRIGWPGPPPPGPTRISTATHSGGGGGGGGSGSRGVVVAGARGAAAGRRRGGVAAGAGGGRRAGGRGSSSSGGHSSGFRQRIEQEIVDRGDDIAFDDIAGLTDAKRILCVAVAPSRRPSAPFEAGD